MVKKLLFLSMIAITINNIYPVTFQEIRKMPKAELHLHLGGSYPLEYLKTIATESDLAALQKGIDQFVDGVDYTQCFFVFDLINRIINSNKRVMDGTIALCKALQDDGVEYVEIRTGLKDLGSGYGGYLKTVLKGIKAAASDAFKAQLLLSIKRSSPREHVEQTIDLALKYKDHGVIGIDISDNSTNGDITHLLPLLIDAKVKGLSFVVHMGESPLEKDQMVLLKELQPARIGHGVHLQPEAVEWIKAHKIPVEVCLSSSVCARMVKSYAMHPGLSLYREGHPIAICTDDPLIFRTTLSQEYWCCANELQLSLQQIKELIENSLDYRLDNTKCNI